MRFLCYLVAVGCAWAQAARTAHIFVIGVDGLSPRGIRDAEAPNLRALMQRGAWTLRARGVLPTVSSPNWASMISGAGPAQHGVTSNDWQRDRFEIEPVCRGSDGIFPTLFGVLREQKPTARIGIIHDWDGFGRLVERTAADINAHHKGSRQATAAALEWWRKNRPELMFLHLDDVDHAGHEHGWHGPEYTRAVAEIDALIGKLLRLLRETGKTDEVTLLVSSDHGGHGRKHGAMAMSDLEIPWIAAGPGIRPGEIRVPVNTWDTAVTVAALLGVRPHPCWIGRVVTEALVAAPRQ